MSLALPQRLPGLAARRAQGFTLFEMLAVVALTTLVITVAVNFFLELSRASSTAAERMRAERRASALLDRVARDLEGTYLVKKPKETDPLEHPWLFLAESTGAGGGAGADRLKFETRSAVRRTSAEHESDVTVVAYGARPSAEGGIEIVRWSAPRLPEGLDRDIPVDEGSDAQVLTSGVATFGVRFLDEAGAWQTAWDSSQLTDSSELPVGAEIEVTMLAPEGPVSDADAASQPEAVGPFVRQVILPVRPIDLEALLEPDEAAAAAAAGEEKEDEDGEKTSGEGESQQAKADAAKEDEPCMTVAQCLSLNPGVVQQFPQIQSIITAIGGQCFRDVAASIPPGVNLVGCQ